MNCPTCGVENPERARFCLDCGASLAAATEPVSTSPSLVGTSSGFVGRQEEMRELTSALEGALAGRGRLVMLAGEPGIGKTRTAQELASIAEPSGARILWGRCYEGEGAPPYWPWIKPLQSIMAQTDDGQLRRDMGSEAAEIAGILTELRDRFPDLETPASLDPEEARFRLFNSLTTFLKNASQRQPLVLILDDLHWADSASLLLLEFVAQELPSFPMLVLGTYRDVEVTRRHPLSRTLGVLVREQEFSRLQLRGLDRSAVAEILRLASGNEPSGTMVEAVLGRTEGNPLFVSEISGVIGREGERGLTSIPEGVKDAIGWRLNRLTEECNEVLTVASVIGREFNHRQLRLLFDTIAEDRLMELLEEALVSRVIEEAPQEQGGYQFTHALIQETLAEELTANRRVRLHARIAEALEELYKNNAEVHGAELAYHFAEAESVLGSDKLVRYSLMAGERALTSYAYEEALAHFERPLGTKEDQPMDGDTAALLFGLGRAQAATLARDRLGEAFESLARAFDYYAEAGDVPRAVAVAEYPFVIIGGSALPGMAQVIARALDLVPSDTHQAGRLLSRYGVALGGSPTNYPAARKAFEDALAIAQREADTRLEVRTLVDACRLEGLNLNFAKSLRALELLEEVDDPGTEVPAHHWAAMAMLILGDLQGAKAHAQATLAPAERARYRALQIIALATNAPIAIMEGNWEAARDFISRGLIEAPQEIFYPGAMAMVEHQLGNFQQGETYLQQMIENAQLPNQLGALYRQAQIIPIVARITGESSRLEVAQTAAEDLLSIPSTPPLYTIIARNCLGLIAVLREEAEAAQEQYQALGSARAGEHFGIVSTDRLLGLLAHTMGNLSQAITHFEDALVFCRKAGYRPELAWAWCDYADTLLQRASAGSAQAHPVDREKAISLLDEALAISTELGMHPLVERVARLQEQAQVRPSATPTYPDGLTQREVEVLGLIAAGKNNREIAEELVVSVGTVANHVTSILNKASLKNRTEAAGYAFRQGLA
ncbi:MAG: AAA family ATPase [Dehalococcoidia bacterium]